jgi:MFS family permease
MIRKICEAYREAFAGVPRSVWMLAAVLLVSRSGMMVLPFLALYLTQERDLSEVAAGRVIAVWSAAGIAGTYLGGRLCSRVGAVRVVLLSLLLAVPGFVAMPHAPTVAWLCVALAYQGIVLEAARPASQTAATLLSPPHLHAKSLAVMRLALNLGFTVGPTVGGLLAKIDFHLLFYVNALFMLAGAVVGALGFRPWQSQPLIAEDEPYSLETKPLRDRLFVWYLVLQFFAGLVFFQLLATMPLAWRDRYGFSEPVIGVMFAVNTVIIVVFELLLIRVINHLAPLRLIAWGTMLIAIGFGMMAFGTSLSWAVASVLTWTLGEMLAAPYSATFVAQRSSTRTRGAYMGYFSMTFSAANVAAPVIGTWLYSQHPDLPWYFCLALGCVLPFGFLRLLDAQQSELRGPPRPDGQLTPSASEALV